VSGDPLGLRFVTEENARRISAALGEPGWLLGERLDAVRRYSELPAETNPLFTTYLDLRAARFAEIEPYAEPVTGGQLSTELPEGAAVLLHVDEGRVAAHALSSAARSAGVVVDTVENVLRERPELLHRVIADGRTLPPRDAFAQVPRAVSTVGAFVHVPAGVALEEPIVVRWSVGRPGRGLISRTVVHVGEDAHIRLLEEQVESFREEGPQSLWWGTTEVALDDRATLDVAGQQDLGPSTLAFVNRQAILEREAGLRWAMASIGGAYQKSRIDNQLVGRGASVRQAEIAFGDRSQHFDLTSYTRHFGEDTTGDLLSKGVFLDRSRGYFKGLIEIHKSARGTDSFLGEFAMLLTKKARSVAIPSLEIDQPDVRRASHSSSVGPIDESQVFYLMSRGLDRDTARKFIVLGFLEPVVARIPLPEAQERLRALIDHKWPAAAPDTAAAAA